MNRQEIIHQIERLAEKELKILITSKNLKASLILDLGLDSLSIVEFLIAIEDTFGMKYPETLNTNLNSLQDIINYTLKQLSSD